MFGASQVFLEASITVAPFGLGIRDPFREFSPPKPSLRPE
jgi:hypothetical protein